MDSFINAQYLATLAGQASVVLLFTQAARNAVPAMSTYGVRLTAVACGLAVHALMTWRADLAPVDYLVLVVNGMSVALMAIKTAEFVKGDSDSKPGPTPRRRRAPSDAVHTKTRR